MTGFGIAQRSPLGTPAGRVPTPMYHDLEKSVAPLANALHADLVAQELRSGQRTLAAPDLYGRQA